MPLFNRDGNTPRQPLGSALGNIYARLRGLNPMGALRQFRQDFRTSAGIPEGAKLWTNTGGIQLGNMPTLETTAMPARNLSVDLPNVTNLSASAPTKGIGSLAEQLLGSKPSAATPANLAMSPDALQAAIAKTPATAMTTTPIDVAVPETTSTVLTPGKGISLGTLANAGMGLYQGGKALKGLYDNTTADSDLQSLKNDINLSMASNPMYDMYMDAADEKLLRQMRNGTLNNSVAKTFEGAATNIPSTLLQAGLGYLVGGVPGALINGIGGLVNSGISGYRQGTEEANTKLSGLYNKLKQAEEEYRSMRRPRGLSSAGLQSRYFNELY